MTAHDCAVVQEHLADIVEGLPCHLNQATKRVEITYAPEDVEWIADDLAQSLGRKGYDWDVWTEDDTIFIAEKEN